MQKLPECFEVRDGVVISPTDSEARVGSPTSRGRRKGRSTGGGAPPWSAPDMSSSESVAGPSLYASQRAPAAM